MNNHTLSKQDFYSNNSDLSGGYGFINSHNLSQCDDSNTFKEMGAVSGKGDVSSGYGYINSNTIYQ